MLAACYRSCLALAEAAALSSIAFPAISTGVFGYPLVPATRIAVQSVREHSSRHLELVRFVCFDVETLDAYLELLNQSG